MIIGVTFQPEKGAYKPEMLTTSKQMQMLQPTGTKNMDTASSCTSTPTSTKEHISPPQCVMWKS